MISENWDRGGRGGAGGGAALEMIVFLLDIFGEQQFFSWYLETFTSSCKLRNFFHGLLSKCSNFSWYNF